jgi:circadian clock protein KaiB
MLPAKKKESNRDWEKAAVAAEETRYVLRLYVTGATARSLLAIRNIKEICEEHLKDRYRLEVIDIYKHPALARGDQILAAPTLIRKLPNPLRRLIGDLSNKEKVLLGLEIKPAGKKGV